MQEYSPRQASAYLKERGIKLGYSTLVTRCHQGKIAFKKVPLLYSTRYTILIPQSEIDKIVHFYNEGVTTHD